MTRQCIVCKQVVLIEALQDPGGVCRDCYVIGEILQEAELEKEYKKNDYDDCGPRITLDD